MQSRGRISLLLSLMLLPWSVAITSGCSQNEEPVLIAGIGAGISFLETQRLLSRQLSEWKNVELTTLDPDDNRPPYRFEIWETDNLSLAQLTGSARFSYFNERLIAIEVFPTDGQDSVQDSPGVTVRTGKDYRGRRFVRIEAKKLMNELNSWISKYS